VNNSAAPIAPDPEIRTTASKLTAITTMIAANRETVETRSRIGRSLSATIGLLAFSISPPASGSSISRVRNRAIRSESTCAPTTTCGRATGKYIVVPTISRTTNSRRQRGIALRNPGDFRHEWRAGRKPQNEQAGGQGRRKVE